MQWQATLAGEKRGERQSWQKRWEMQRRPSLIGEGAVSEEIRTLDMFTR
jgi:hypothetical protein